MNDKGMIKWQEEQIKHQLKLLDELKAENEQLKARLEKANYAVNKFIEELAWLDIQYAAQASGMFNEACGQPCKSAIPTYRTHYDKMFENAQAEAEKALKELEGKE